VYFQHHKQLEEVAANAFLDVELPCDLKTRTTTDLAHHTQVAKKKGGEHWFVVRLHPKIGRTILFLRLAGTKVVPAIKQDHQLKVFACKILHAK
jgi:hypothetical protein